MSQPEQLFRQEALDTVAHHRGPGELVRVSAAWVDNAYWGLLALVLAGAVGSLLVEVGDEPLLYVVVPALKTVMERLMRA